LARLPRSVRRGDRDRRGAHRDRHEPIEQTPRTWYRHAMSPSGPALHVILKRFDAPDEERVFEKGRFEIVRVGGTTIGRATYEPGWKWSVYVGAKLGQAMCEVEHVGMVVSGCVTVV
jgi:hypothetical protein